MPEHWINTLVTGTRVRHLDGSTGTVLPPEAPASELRDVQWDDGHVGAVVDSDVAVLP